MTGAAARAWTASTANCQEPICHVKAVAARAPKMTKDGKEKA